MKIEKRWLVLGAMALGTACRALRIATEGQPMKRTTSALMMAGLFAAATAAGAASVTFYQAENYGGRQFATDAPITDFGRNGFNDRVHSAVVHDGRWEICVDAEFQGSCSVLGPGAYPSLGASAGRVGSVRPIDARSGGRRADERGRNRDARATLYEGPSLSGRSYALSETMPNLGGTGFNDRASSLHVDSGYWIFCSDSDFRGECRTFGPGDYVSLPGMNDAISSGRRIANDYPYGDKPDWQRGSMHQSQNGNGRPN